MSLYGALRSAWPVLMPTARPCRVASSNIANVNTVGYKASNNAFSTLLASASGSGDATQAGVIARQAQNVTTQGDINGTALADGSGDLRQRLLRRQPEPAAERLDESQFYTRAGNFTPDANGNLRNAAGMYLLGWPLDSQRQRADRPQRPCADQRQQLCRARRKPPPT